MKAIIYLFLAVLAATPGFSQVRKTLFVIADGIPADVIEKLQTPNLKSIASNGGFLHASVGGEKDGYSQTPTISAVGYNTILTGTWVNKHNVWDNDIAKPNYHYKTIFRLLKEQDPSKKTAIFSSWLDNRTKLVGDNFPETGNIAVDYHFDGLELDTVKYPHDEQRKYMHKIDEAVIDHAASAIRSEAPDLSWVYLEYTDDMGHMHGDSPQFYEAVKMMDQQIGRLWKSIEYRQKKFKEDWLIIITTDHGRDAKTGHNHGGQSDRERSGWIVTNAKDLNDYSKNGSPSIADIMPTIAKFMHIDIQKDDLMEVDGTPLIGSLAATHATAEYKDGKINIHWKKVSKEGNAKIWLAKTNQYQTGGKDEYKLAATVPLSQENAEIDAGPSEGPYKIVIDTPQHYLTRWVVIDKGAISPPK